MNANEPAFPGNYYVKDAAGLNCTHFPGMTKRELFAAMIMQGLVTNSSARIPLEEMVVHAANGSDALIAELSKAKP